MLDKCELKLGKDIRLEDVIIHSSRKIFVNAIAIASGKNKDFGLCLKISGFYTNSYEDRIQQDYMIYTDEPVIVVKE